MYPSELSVNGGPCSELSVSWLTHFPRICGMLAQRTPLQDWLKPHKTKERQDMLLIMCIYIEALYARAVHYQLYPVCPLSLP